MPLDFPARLKELLDRYGILYVDDEIQSGCGRTGTMWAYEQVGVRPDAITVAKGLGGGLPLGAMLTFGDAAGLLAPGQHASTFGGNPVCCAAALAVLDTIEAECLLDQVKRVGERLRHGIEALGHPLVTGVRGTGLLLGIVLAAPVAGALSAALLDAGYLAQGVQPEVLRLAPPLILTPAQADGFLAALPAGLDAARGASQ